MLVLCLIYIVCAGYALIMWKMSSECQKENCKRKIVITIMLGGNILFGIPEILFTAKAIDNVIQQASIENYFLAIFIGVVSVVVTIAGMNEYRDKTKKAVILIISLICLAIGCICGFYGAGIN